MADLSLSGVGSGIDWQSMIDQLTQVEEQSLTPYNDQISTAKNKLSEWQIFGGKLSTFQAAADALKSNTGLDLFTANLTSSSSTSASSLLSATASASSGKGSYQVVINNKAQAEKLASGSFSSETSALNLSGAFLVNGKAIQVASTDTLKDIASKINTANSGTGPSHVSASIIQDSPTTYRLVLTSENTGAAGIGLQNGSGTDLLATLGFNGSGTTLKNKVTGAAESDGFSSTSTGVDTLLGIENQSLSGTVTINGTSVDISLSDTLDQIKDDLVAKGISASIVSEGVKNDDGTTDTTYRLKIEGMSNWTDDNNVLQALGVIEGTREDEIGVASNVANTTDGSTAITSDTKVTDIYGYVKNSTGDKITISGTTHDGTAVTSTDLAITSDTTVGDLLKKVESLFGNVTASLTSDGKIQVIDNATGTSKLSVSLQATLADPNAGFLDFGTFGAAGAVRMTVLQQGEDASFSVDGMSMTSSSNTVTTAIQGVTLNLLGEDSGTTVTVDVGYDTSAIETKINAMISGYNDVISYVNTQMTYNQDSKTTGGALFGDNTLKMIKSQLQDTILTPVGTGAIKYLSDIGITVGDDAKLSLDTSTFESKLATNFDDVVKLLSDSGTSDNSQIQYVYSARSTQSGTYAVDITQLGGTNQNIEGTIGGAATGGSGNYLTVTDTTSKAYGLEIEYTGSTLPTTTAHITVNRGIASLFESLLNSFTDSVNGAVTLQENGLQTNIDALNTKVTNMQSNIDDKMAALKTQYVNMDTAIAQLKSTQSYLSTQLASL